jgi:phage shock protein A
MNLLERVLTLLRANLNTVVENSEDPEKVLRQLQLDMHNQLVQVKTQVATAIAESHKLQKRSKEKKVEADGWLKKAEQAVQQGNDEGARAALTNYNEINRQMERYQQLHTEQEYLVATMRKALRQLEAKKSEVETTIELLVTRKRNALLQQRVFDALNKNTGQKEQERTTKAQDDVMEAEARARALAHLHKQSFEGQLEQISEEEEIEQKLKELKAKNHPLQEFPRLHEGKPQSSPLIRPEPKAGEPIRKRVTNDKNKASGETASDVSSAKEIDIEHLKKLLEAQQDLFSHE